MNEMHVKIGEPNLKAAEEICKLFKDWHKSKEFIKEHFCKHSVNTSYPDVLVKVILVDSLYSTHINDPLLIAEKIRNINLLDDSIKNGDISVVEKISKTADNKKILCFASKFCHFHDTDTYPIYDKYVCIALNVLRNWKINRDYQDFVKVMIDFKNETGCKDFEQVDTFLWLYGQREEFRKNPKGFGKSRQKFINENKPLFDALGD